MKPFTAVSYQFFRMTLSRMTLSRMTYSIKAEDCYADFVYIEYYLSLVSQIRPLNADCRYAECRYAECRYAEWRYAEWRYAERPGTVFWFVLLLIQCPSRCPNRNLALN
jgi:hypothetical protein